MKRKEMKRDEKEERRGEERRGEERNYPRFLSPNIAQRRNVKLISVRLRSCSFKHKARTT
jgi:hypothetical protein